MFSLLRIRNLHWLSNPAVVIPFSVCATLFLGSTLLGFGYLAFGLMCYFPSRLIEGLISLIDSTLLPPAQHVYNDLILGEYIKRTGLLSAATIIPYALFLYSLFIGRALAPIVLPFLALLLKRFHESEKGVVALFAAVLAGTVALIDELTK